MMGLIFNLLEDFTNRQLGPIAWDRIVERARSELSAEDAAYTSLGNYADADLFTLIDCAVEVSGISARSLVHAFGRYLVPALARRYPALYEQHRTAKSFLLAVDETIHVEVKKLYPETVLPTFRYEEPSPTRLVMIYRSPRRLCALAEGMITGAAEHFREKATVRQTECMLNGADACRLEIAFG
jgi:predicted hydrocarbon binding protein